MSINGNQINNFSIGKIRFIPLKKLYSKRPTELPNYINSINKIRSNYQYSKKLFTEDNIENVYLIIYNTNIIVGFFECRYENLDITNSRQIEIFIDDMHISPTVQNKGIGKYVFDYLLKKTNSIQFVIAKQNSKVKSLVENYKHEVKHDNQNTQTIIIRRQV